MRQLSFAEIAPDGAARSLRVREPSDRLRAATAIHDDLLARIARRRKARDRLEHDIRTSVASMVSQVAPLVDESRRVDHDIHEAMTALIGDASRPRRERDRLRRLYRDLQRGGVITTREQPATADMPPWWTPSAGMADDDDEPGSDHGWHDSAPASARRPDGDRGVLRDLFRRLVEAVHPDQVQDETLKAERTEVMKQVTVAYQDGDLARLVEIERTWNASRAAASRPDDDTERRCARLEQTNHELRAQLRDLDREIRDMRRSPEGALHAEQVRQRKRGGDVTAPMTTELEHELETLREVRDFVGRFRAGEISLDDLVAGPAAYDDDADHADAIAEMLAAAAREVAARRRRPAPKARARAPKAAASPKPKAPPQPKPKAPPQPKPKPKAPPKRAAVTAKGRGVAAKPERKKATPPSRRKATSTPGTAKRRTPKAKSARSRS